MKVVILKIINAQIFKVENLNLPLLGVSQMSQDKLAERTRFTFPPYTYTYDSTRWEDLEIPADTIYLRDGWSHEHSLPDHITKAAKDAIDRGSRYIFTGDLELRQAIADKLQKANQISVNPKEEILLTNGGSEAMFLSVWSIVNEGDEVIFADPGYVCGWAPNVLMSGGKMLYIPAKEERRFRIDPEDVERSITKRTKMILISTPDNPTGAVLNKNDLGEIAELSIEHDLIVVFDESFEKIMYRSYPGSIASFPGMKNRTITINGFAKNYNMPGYRIGYAAGPKIFIDKMARIQSHTTVSTSDIGQAAALAALTGPQHWVEEAVKVYRARRDLLVEGLNRIRGIRCVKPDGYFAAFPKIDAFGMSSYEFVRYLLKEAHVKVDYSSRMEGVRADGYVSMGFSSSSEQQIDEALDRISAALEKL